MGIFSSKKKVYVSSVVYNMAGDEDERPNYVKTAVIGHVIGSRGGSIADTLNQSMLGGPGIKLKSFARWARFHGYNAHIGQVSGDVAAGNVVNNTALQSIVPHTPGDTVTIQSVNIGNADYTYWVDQYISNFHTDLINTNYVSEFKSNGQIHIAFEGGGGVDFTPADWDPQGRYMYVAYNTENGSGLYFQVYIYRYGTGNAVLDGMFAGNDDVGDFFPFIPIRLDNQWLSAVNTTSYEWAKKAYRKAFNDNYDDLVSTIADNDAIADIDYAYIVFGVSLNSKENTAQKYAYRFFETIMNQGTYDGSYGSWQAAWDAAVAQMEIWSEWKVAQDDPLDPLYGDPEPTKPVFPRMPNNMVQITSTPSSGMNYNMTVRWASLVESFGSGLKKPDAKAGDVWWDVGGTNSYSEPIYADEPIITDSFDISTTYLTWQVDANLWRTLTFTGLIHENLIYKGKSVEITAYEAITDPEESGFIIPLHEDIYQDMGLKDGTQMSTSCAFLVFNCYVVKKIRWYQRKAFKILVIVAIIVLAVYTAGASLAAGSGGGIGVLGANAAVGAAFGATALTAVIIGAVANAIAAMVLIQIIQTGAVALFGDQIGSIIGAIVSVVTLHFATALSNGLSMSAYVAEMATAQNILGLTNALGNGYAGYVQAATAKIAGKTQDLLEQFEEDSKKLDTAWDNLMGVGPNVVDPLVIQQAVAGPFMSETSDSFLSRTLMVGSDVAELSMALLSNFTEMTLAQKL